ncbi:unnamed protein product, partial [Pylaiella littoralis]
GSSPFCTWGGFGSRHGQAAALYPLKKNWGKLAGVGGVRGGGVGPRRFGLRGCRKAFSQDVYLRSDRRSTVFLISSLSAAFPPPLSCTPRMGRWRGGGHSHAPLW